MDVLNIPLTPRSDFWRLRNTLISFEMDSNYSRSFRMVLIALCHFAEMCVPYQLEKHNYLQACKKTGNLGSRFPANLAPRGRIMGSRGKILDLAERLTDFWGLSERFWDLVERF